MDMDGRLKMIGGAQIMLFDLQYLKRLCVNFMVGWSEFPESIELISETADACNHLYQDSSVSTVSLKVFNLEIFKLRGYELSSLYSTLIKDVLDEKN